MCRSVSGFICVHLLEPIVHDIAHVQRMVFTQGCCHACPRRKRCCLVCSSAACCLFVDACSSHDHLVEPRVDTGAAFLSVHIHRFCELSPCLLSCISTRNMFVICCSGQLDLSFFISMRFICNHRTEQRDRFP
jgi:hypothetical protein